MHLFEYFFITDLESGLLYDSDDYCDEGDKKSLADHSMHIDSSDYVSNENLFPESSNVFKLQLDGVNNNIMIGDGPYKPDKNEHSTLRGESKAIDVETLGKSKKKIF